MVFPFLNQRGLRRRGNDQHVRLPLQFAQRIRDFRERRHALADDTVDRFVDRDRPSERLLHQRVARFLDVFGQRDVPQLRFGVHPVDQNLRNLDRNAAARDFRTFVQEAEHLDQRRKAVDSARLRVKVDELRRLASVLANALQAPMLDDIRNETLFMFQLHCVERATVGVDPDEKIAIFLKIDHRKTLPFGRRSTRRTPLERFQNNAASKKNKNQIRFGENAFSAKSSFSLYPGAREKKGGAVDAKEFRRPVVRFVFIAPKILRSSTRSPSRNKKKSSSRKRTLKRMPKRGLEPPPPVTRTRT